MIKKIIIVFLVFSLGGLIIWRLKKKKIVDSGTKQDLFSSSQKVKKEYDYQWTNWEDPAGFGFEYPEEIEINDHPEDEVNYAYLTFSHQDHSGKIIITCNDSEDEDIDGWLKNNKKIKGASALETEIASVSGRKLALGQGKEMTAFIDWDKVLYTIEIEAQDQNYWQPVYKHILDTFELIPLKGETKAQFEDWLEGFDTSGADVIEPVEVIQ